MTADMSDSLGERIAKRRHVDGEPDVDWIDYAFEKSMANLCRALMQ